MGTNAYFEIILGDEIIELVKDECQTESQVNVGIAALMSAKPIQLPTPSPSPPPSESTSPVQYQSPRWPKRLKLPCSVLEVDTNQTVDSSPLENIPCDIMWLILQTLTISGQTLSQNDHVSLILASKTMTIKYLDIYARNTSMLQRRKLVTFDRIAAPVARRPNRALALLDMLEDSADTECALRQPADRHAFGRELKRARPEPDDESSVGSQQVTEESEGESRSVRKRQKTASHS